MPSWQDTLIIASGLVREFRGDHPVANPGVVNLPVWPHSDSGGRKATEFWVQPRTNAVHIQALSHSSSPIVNTIGPASARLAGDQLYIFSLHPTVNTLQFLDAQSSSTVVDVTWVIP